MQQSSFIDRAIDFLRSKTMLFLLLGFAAGSALFYQPESGQHVMLTIHNQDSISITSIRMEFGFDHNQSNLLTLQLKPGEQRLLALNHPPGKGFNVEVQYQDGHIQSFCANKNISGQQQKLALKR